MGQLPRLLRSTLRPRPLLLPLWAAKLPLLSRRVPAAFPYALLLTKAIAHQDDNDRRSDLNLKSRGKVW